MILSLFRLQERLTNIGPEEFVQSFMKEGTEDAQVSDSRGLQTICYKFERNTVLSFLCVCAYMNYTKISIILCIVIISVEVVHESIANDLNQ